MHKISRIGAALIIPLLLPACADQRILEELGTVHTTSYDLLPEEEGKSSKELLITMTIPKNDPENRKVREEILTTTSINSKGGRIRLSRKTELSLVSGQLRNVLFGSRLAKEGIWPLMDTFQRDPSISQRLKITVVDGSAHDLVTEKYPPHPMTGPYIERMLEKQEKSKMSAEATLYDFTRDYYDDGIDPIAPIVKKQGGNVVMEGIALFNEDRYMTKIPADEVLIFGFLQGDFRQGELSMDFGESANKEANNAMFTSLISKRKIKVFANRSRDDITVNVSVQIKGSVLEYNGKMDLSIDQDRRKLERLISEQITDKANDMISKMQKNNVDSLGLGQYVRNSMSYGRWKKLNWEEVYPHVRVHCKATMVIKDYGKFK
ncbi:hypothetical protein SD71_17760 [Cohnella kolymensis]|uniref:Uncharacterized protein n=1 Tax=Cohnella kolymensis TaxID=1590652 RepID=A0ABR5A2I2_9BACL|nr:Ger(x)C family spore germination protein [Cohnella kolymensis]KIL34848.1 hypothetical protein SD71_17760 [Cohnella kolymensis]